MPRNQKRTPQPQPTPQPPGLPLPPEDVQRLLATIAGLHAKHRIRAIGVALVVAEPDGRLGDGLGYAVGDAPLAFLALATDRLKARVLAHQPTPPPKPEKSDA